MVSRSCVQSTIGTSMGRAPMVTVCWRKRMKAYWETTTSSSGSKASQIRRRISSEPLPTRMWSSPTR